MENLTYSYCIGLHQKGVDKLTDNERGRACGNFAPVVYTLLSALVSEVSAIGRKQSKYAKGSFWSIFVNSPSVRRPLKILCIVSPS
jgi:hypothetical protein